MAQAKPACGSHPHDCNADVLSIQYNNVNMIRRVTVSECGLRRFHEAYDVRSCSLHAIAANIIIILEIV